MVAEASGRFTQALEELRERVRPMLSFSAPVDAIYTYYALYHEPERTQLYLHEDGAGRADGFVAVCQTGQRLFQPTVALRTPDARGAIELLRQALAPGRPYYVITTPDLRDAVAEVVHIEQPTVNCLYGLDVSRFQPSINVLVVAEQGMGGLPRFVIRSQGQTVAEAGINWCSPHYAEVFVRTESGAQRRGWGRAVVTACTTWIIRSGRQPLFVVHDANRPGRTLAEAVGFVDTGAREFAGEGVCRP